jgi:hypothetical protein
VGDAIGTLSAANLLQAVRPDGVIVKPDVPIVPIDASFQNSAQGADAPMIASTYTDFGSVKAWYIFAYPQGQNTTAALRLADLDASGPVYLYDYFAGSGAVVNAGDALNLPISGSALYLVAAPVGPSRMAVIGDIGQFVTLGKKRISRLVDDGNVQLTVAFAPGEAARTIQLYSPAIPHIRVHCGSVEASQYNADSGLFSVTLGPSSRGEAEIVLFSGLSSAHARHSENGAATPSNSQ